MDLTKSSLKQSAFSALESGTSVAPLSMSTDIFEICVGCISSPEATVSGRSETVDGGVAVTRRDIYVLQVRASSRMIVEIELGYTTVVY
jgi:hypothetical protein